MIYPFTNTNILHDFRSTFYNPSQPGPVVNPIGELVTRCGYLSKLRSVKRKKKREGDFSIFLSRAEPIRLVLDLVPLQVPQSIPIFGLRSDSNYNLNLSSIASLERFSWIRTTVRYWKTVQLTQVTSIRLN